MNRDFSIKMMNDRVNDTLEILSLMTAQNVAAKRRRLAENYHHFLFNHPPQKDDAFHMLLRTLERKLHPYKRIGRLDYL